MATHAQIVQGMIDALALSEPELDTSIGTVVRKILDAVAEPIAERDGEGILLDYVYDIDARSGADLDEMVRLFGFSRLPATRATGEVVFSRTNPSATDIFIPAGTQITNLANDPIVSTSVNAVLPIGDLSISVPAMAVDGGTAGNAAANTLTVFRVGVPGITAVNNVMSFNGGTDEESDAHLRKRFKETVFRNMAGTEQMFTGIALSDPAVTHASVIGASNIHRERIELIGGTGKAVNIDATYIMPGSVVFGPNIQEGDILREDVHYSVTVGHTLQPTVTSLDPATCPDGIYDIEFSYTSLLSRNEPSLGITNRIDVYVHGTRQVEATEALIFDNTLQFNSTPSSPLYRNNYRRPNHAMPSAGNFLIPYALIPLIDPSTNDQVIINGVTYLEGTHYWKVRDIAARGSAPRSLGGIELRSSANGSPLADPPNGATFTVNSVYNEVPRSVENAIENWRLVGTDVWVHESNTHRLKLAFGVILANGYTLQQVQSDLERNLSKFLDSVGFTRIVQASDLLYVAHGTPGVDSIRWLTDADNPTNYAIIQVSETGTFVKEWTYGSGAPTEPKRVRDVHLNRTEVPILHSIFLDPMAQNTWGTM